MNAWHVATAAEALTAAQLARLGWDISVQYGANQPEYDLVAADGDRMLKVSVKGSKDGAWGLTQSYLTKGKADYHEAIQRWLARHGSKTVFSLVQFQGVDARAMPRMYIATPSEIAAHLAASSAGHGGTKLHERIKWTARAKGAGTVDAIPDDWQFTPERVDAVVAKLGVRN